MKWGGLTGQPGLTFKVKGIAPPSWQSNRCLPLPDPGPPRCCRLVPLPLAPSALLCVWGSGSGHPVLRPSYACLPCLSTKVTTVSQQLPSKGTAKLGHNT